MKVWIEWKASQKLDIAIPPNPPNVFTTRENLVEFWKRTRFPADIVDWLFEIFDKGDRSWLEHEGYVAAEVEVDDYFVKKFESALKEANAETPGNLHCKTKGAARSCPRCKQSKDGCEYYDSGTCRGMAYPTYPPKYDPCVFE